MLTTYKGGYPAKAKQRAIEFLEERTAYYVCIRAYRISPCS